jgi:hypothetical protein
MIRQSCRIGTVTATKVTALPRPRSPPHYLCTTTLENADRMPIVEKAKVAHAVSSDTRRFNQAPHGFRRFKNIPRHAHSLPCVDTASVFGLYLDIGSTFDSLECANECLGGWTKACHVHGHRPSL